MKMADWQYVGTGKNIDTVKIYSFFIWNMFIYGEFHMNFIQWQYPASCSLMSRYCVYILRLDMPLCYHAIIM